MQVMQWCEMKVSWFEKVTALHPTGRGKENDEDNNDDDDLISFFCAFYPQEPEEPIIRDKITVVSSAWVDLKDNVS